MHREVATHIGGHDCHVTAGITGRAVHLQARVTLLGSGEYSAVRWRMRGVAYACASARVGLGSGVSADRAGAGAENTDALSSRYSEGL